MYLGTCTNVPTVNAAQNTEAQDQNTAIVFDLQIDWRDASSSNHLFGIIVGEYKEIWLRDGKEATVNLYWS